MCQYADISDTDISIGPSLSIKDTCYDLTRQVGATFVTKLNIGILSHISESEAQDKLWPLESDSAWGSDFYWF